VAADTASDDLGRHQLKRRDGSRKRPIMKEHAMKTRHDTVSLASLGEVAALGSKLTGSMATVPHLWYSVAVERGIMAIYFGSPGPGGLERGSIRSSIGIELETTA
jgi:hypothetical protein